MAKCNRLFLLSGDGFLTAGVQRTCIEQAAAEAWHLAWGSLARLRPVQGASMQRPGPILVSAAAEPAIKLLFETPRRSSGLRWRTAGGGK